ncbi:hypothetical protein H4J50_11535 [Colwellia sp. 6M3]|jgi:hypothetical protein|uniref:hypothetical protein n=1 Tax=Colwellia sp. 6M3 TaxID=2759849 RepID=UPI0015F4683C|nr:hypothetical protein [Colwellia sp. 6M3]MBA6416647.1 hypothetical protein [Colwellia sp. 6M3]|tara:strand:- start:3266 stop:4129 length:864 start_codon:yes stop_codon:yes gene_type:complete
MPELSMNQTLMKHFHSWGYQGFKYLIYTLLAFNVYLFFSEEWLASKVIFASGVNLDSIIKAFSSTIDTAAWLVLLLLFELETSVIDDEHLKGKVKWSLHGIRAFCYLFIIYSLYGYMTKIGLIGQFTAHKVSDLCTLAGDWKFMETLNVYNEFTKETCKSLSTVGAEFFSHEKYKIITNSKNLSDVNALAWVDVINASAWVSVVLMLEVDVHTQLGNISSKWWGKYNKFIKATVYSILLLAAVYWGVTGNFLEFWDAFLWIVAFVLIEMNMFEWQAEIADRKSHQGQ